MMTKDKLRQLKGDERLGQMRESEYLGAEDIDDGVEPVLTIARSVERYRDPSSAARRTRMYFPSPKSGCPASCRYGP